MAENLFPEDELDEEIEAEELDDEEEAPVGYMESVFFDETLGDFARDGQHRLRSATGVEAWEQWCSNCLLTEKDTYPAYGELFGISTAEVFGTSDRELAESILTVEITEGLMNDPYGRTEFVESIDFEWIGADAVQVHLVVRGIDDASIDLTTTIDQRAR